jgi:NAD(P)-dependent dehydrogenase (short-subunit alcohol dehydrogenase family)
MNICVIGGAGPKGKFGRDFCDRARDEGHAVYVLSHKDHGQGDPKQSWANFNSVESVVDMFTQLIADIDHIDIFVYNSNPHPHRPSLDIDYKSTSIITSEMWYNTIIGHAIIPHRLCIEALKKMSADSKLIFLVSGLAVPYNEHNYTHLVGYSTGKSIQIFMMKAFAEHNDRGAIATAVSPHFDYTNADRYKITVDKVYNYILDMDRSENGKIKNFYNTL